MLLNRLTLLQPAKDIHVLRHGKRKNSCALGKDPYGEVEKPQRVHRGPGSDAVAKQVRVRECLAVPWWSGGEMGVQLGGLLRMTWQRPISITSRQRHAPFAVHGATRQAANGGSSLAGF